MTPTFGELVGGLIVLVGVGVVAFASIAQGNEAAMTALVALVSAGSGYFLRAKVEGPKLPSG